MGWMQKLCETYDSVIGTNAVNEANHPLVPVGFTTKKLGIHVVISAEGEFVSANRFDDAEASDTVPSTPEAEARTSWDGETFPLCEQLKRISNDANYDKYMRQLREWSARPDAPECIKTLHEYLAKGTLRQDLAENAPGFKFDSKKDAEAFVAFSIQDNDKAEGRLWRRADVRESWQTFLSERMNARALCYVEGRQLPVQLSYPKVQGNAKLLSAKDDKMPFQYKGRFLDSPDAMTVSYGASARAHNALAWLLARQGFNRYGMSLVAWNTNGCPMRVPVDDADPDLAEESAAKYPDTFDAYGKALADMSAGYQRKLDDFNPERASQVVIMGMEAATTGRMSINYYQELSGNDYVRRLENWYSSCAWELLRWDAQSKPHRAIAAPKPLEIAEAVMGTQAVRIARKDMKCERAASKLMRQLRLRLLHCIADGDALPDDVVTTAFHRASAPLGFTDDKNAWQPDKWRGALATTCALIRRHQFDRGENMADVILDESCADRSYLYGRLLALANYAEYAASNNDSSRQTNAMRLMQRFVQRPYDTWTQLYLQLLPYLDARSESAGRCRKRFGVIERMFRNGERALNAPLAPHCLQGYYSQWQAMFRPDGDAASDAACNADYELPGGRSELYGCLLALAELTETFSPGRERGSTNAERMIPAFVANPARAWASLHDRLVPYIEKSGQGADYYRRLMGEVERRFSTEERASTKPLAADWLHGYYCMRNALLTKGAQVIVPVGDAVSESEPSGRDGIYGALLALADKLEAWALDGVDERPTNAIRYMAAFADKPGSGWKFLRKKLAPYQKRLGPKGFALSARIAKLERLLIENGFDTDEPLDNMYLHSYYCVRNEKATKDERSENNV